MLPIGSEAYDCAYKEAIERIEGQNPGSVELAKQALSWITCAKRPLTTLELQHALAVEIGESELDEQNLPEVEDIVSGCAGLVIIDENSNIIRLVHYSTQEYFERTQMSWFPDAQRYITMTCVTYLSFDVFAVGVCRTRTEIKARLQSNVLYDYAALNWGYHAYAASTEVKQSIMKQSIIDFLESETNVSVSSSQVLMNPIDGYSYFGIPIFYTTGLHLAAYFGLKEVMVTLHKNGYCMNFKDFCGRTPLSWAAEIGHEAIVKLLLAINSVDPDSRDNDGQTPLSWAAQQGHEVIVKLLLLTNGVDPNSKDRSGFTPLVQAAMAGQENIVKLLLMMDSIDINAKDSCGETPLLRAVIEGQEDIVKLLLTIDGVNSDFKDVFGRTPLCWAAEKGYVAIAKLLLARQGVDPDSKDRDGLTPLLRAARKGHRMVVKLLLTRHDVDPDSKDRHGLTPLSWAAMKGHRIVVRLLLTRHGVDPDSKDRRGQTPLSWAAMKGHAMVVKLLLAINGVDIESKDRYGRTPLSRAREYRRDVIKELLRRSMDLDS
jgi:ankyrin repeat protein